MNGFAGTGTPYVPDEGRIARSWRLTKAAWTVVRGDSTLKLLALLGALSGLAGVAAIFALADVGHAHARGGRVALYAAVLAYPLTFVSVFINTAIAAAASAALDGRRLSLGEALAVPANRIARVAGWALIATVVGVVLEQIANRLPGGGSVAARLVGLGWSLASLFAIPILALEDCSPPECLRRSARMVKSRWGEGVSGSVIVGAWTVIAILGLVVVVAIGVALTASSAVALAALLVLAAVAFVAILALQAVVRQTFVVALYRYAASGEAAGPFGESDLSAPFRRRRGRGR